MSGAPRSLALDGIRGVALAAPIVVHLKLAGGGNGLWLAIGMFFTLSGFLITSLALGEIEKRGRMDVRGFWSRRMRRLLPGAVLVLGLIVVTAWLIDWPAMRALRGDVLAALVWLANWEQLHGGGYWESFAPSLTTHFWSLSLEEQIYLVFPLAIVGCFALRRVVRPAVAVAIVSGAVTALSWTILWRVDDPAYLYLSTWTRMGEAAMGCLAAAVSHLLVRRRFRYASAAIIVLMALVAPFWIFASGETTGGIRWGITAATPLTAAVIALLWRYPRSGPSRAFSTRAPAWLGRRSYGIYLIHLPLFELFAYWLGVERLPPWAMVVAVGATVVLAGLMFRFVEEPIRVGRVIQRPARFAGFVGAISLSLVAITVGLTVERGPGIQLAGTTPPPSVGVGVPPVPPTTTPTTEPGTVVPGTTGASPTTTTAWPGPPATPGTALVIGDSTAWVTTGAVRDGLGPAWTTQEVHMVGCPPGGDVRIRTSVNGGAVGVREIGEERGCDLWWNESLPAWLQTLQPSLVVFVGGYGLAYEVDPNGDDQWCRLGDGSGRCEEWAAGRLAAVADRVHEYAPNAHLVWTTPGHVDPWGPLEIPGSAIDALDVVVREEAGRHRTSLVDLGWWLDQHLNLTVDGTHLGPDGVEALTPWMHDELAAALAGQRIAPAT